jgi:glycosyltransferase involved in cell wall biosynthesis
LQEFPWDYPNTHKVILSDGPQKPKLEAMVAENNWKNVHFLGRVPRDKLTDYVRWADIMPFPSRYETWSLSALEAVASGVPLVARRSGGPSEFVTPGVNGIFVPDGQPLSDGIAAAMAVDRDRCSQTIHAKYGLGNAAQQLLKLAVPMRN